MALKHLTRVNLDRANGGTDIVYINDEGVEVEALPAFRQFLRQRGNAHDSILRYEPAVARFIDFLIECGVFGKSSTPSQISSAMEAYPLFLRDGEKTEHPTFPNLGEYARMIGMPDGLSQNSMLPTLAAVNHFLRFAKEVAFRAVDSLEQAGGQADLKDLGLTFRSIEGREAWSEHQKERFRQQTMLGGVVRVKDELTRPKGLRIALRSSRQIDLENKEFPLNRLNDLFAQARSHRDQALWLLLAGGGLRVHEALNMQLPDINPEAQKIWVIDPENRRFGRETTDRDKVRFKGRQMSSVYMYEPLRSLFWEALEAYIKEEFLATDTHEYLFQKIDGVDRGTPLADASDTALGKQFKAAVKRANVPGPAEAPEHVWTLHSLRHSYGVYMLNYLPRPGGFGLRLTEVQQLMGHASVESTAVYARHDRLLLEAQIEMADTIIFNDTTSAASALEALPKAVADRLRAQADRIEAGGSKSKQLKQLQSPDNKPRGEAARRNRNNPRTELS
jgi:integrase